MFYGYGTIPILPPSPEAAAQQICAVMGGQWRADAQECQVGDQTYTLPDFLPGAMPAGPCPGGEVMTPKGCKAVPPGVEDCPAGQVMTPQGCQPGTTPPVPPPNGGQVTPAQPSTPSWVLPAAVIGVGAIAVIALVTTK